MLRAGDAAAAESEMDALLASNLEQHPSAMAMERFLSNLEMTLARECRESGVAFAPLPPDSPLDVWSGHLRRTARACAAAQARAVRRRWPLQTSSGESGGSGAKATPDSRHSRASVISRLLKKRSIAIAEGCCSRLLASRASISDSAAAASPARSMLTSLTSASSGCLLYTSPSPRDCS